MARLAYQFAQASPRVRGDVVEASEFPELSRKYGVRAVPKSVINEEEEVLGSVPEHHLLQAVLKAGSGSTKAEQSP
jgi:hypothetical protein